MTLCVLTALAFPSFAYSQGEPQENNKLTIFYSPACHRCMEIEAYIIPRIEKEFAGRIRIEYLDISDLENYKLLLSLKEKYGSTIENTLPVFYFKGHFLNAVGNVENGLRVLLGESLREAPQVKGRLPAIDLLAHFKSFRPLAVVSAGLTDGINPCAFTVIVFFISFLSLQGYRKKELIIIGLSFILAVFITYLAIGVGLFSFLYKAKSFWIISRIFNLVVGALSILLGIFALYDFFKFRKTSSTEALLLKLPQPIRHRIHSIIGLHYRKQKGEGGGSLRPHIFRLLLSALTCGFLISILEAVCTGQVYLPTITFVLKSTGFKLEALGYLLLYNIMFIVPLFIIFLFALLGVTSEQFSSIFKRHLGAVKLLMALLFFGLGVFLLWRP